MVSGRSGAGSLELVNSDGRPGRGQFRRPSSVNSARAGRLKVSALVYAAHVRLAQADMNIDGKIVQLSPGMAVSVEVMTGRRRVMEFVLSPVMQRVQESGRAR